MRSNLLNTAAVRPKSILRSTDRSYLRLLQEGAYFTREDYVSGGKFPSQAQHLRLIMPDGNKKVVTVAVFYDLLERGYTQFDRKDGNVDIYVISDKGRKILNGEDPYASPEPLDAVQASYVEGVWKDEDRDHMVYSINGERKGSVQGYWSGTTIVAYAYVGNKEKKQTFHNLHTAKTWVENAVAIDLAPIFQANLKRMPGLYAKLFKQLS